MNSPSMKRRTGSGSEPTSPEAVVALLEARYGLKIDGLERLPIGQGTVNYRASGGADRAASGR